MESNPTTCPKCSYIRKATDDAPLSKCPQCDIVYEKYVAVMAARSTSDTAATPKPSEYINTVPAALSTNLGTRSSRIQKLATGMVIGLFLLVVVSFFGYREYEVYRLRQQLTPLLTPFLKDTAVRVGRAIAAHELVLADSKAVLQKHIVGIDNNLLSVQRLSTNSNEKITGPVIQYMKSSISYVTNTQILITWMSPYLQNEALLVQGTDHLNSSRKLLRDMANDSAAELADRTMNLSKLVLQDRAEILNRILPATEGRIKALEAINDLGHDLAKEFGRDALVDEQALKGALERDQKVMHGIKEQLQTISNTLQKISP